MSGPSCFQLDMALIWFILIWPTKGLAVVKIVIMNIIYAKRNILTHNERYFLAEQELLAVKQKAIGYWVV